VSPRPEVLWVDIDGLLHGGHLLRQQTADSVSSELEAEIVVSILHRLIDVSRLSDVVEPVIGSHCLFRLRCASGCVVECRICNREVAASNLGRGYFTPRSTQSSIPPGSVNEFQLRLGRQRRVRFISLADETQGVQVKL